MKMDDFYNSYKARNFFRLSKMQWLIFSLLVFREQASYDAIYRSYYDLKNDEPDDAKGSIKVQVRKMRIKLNKFEIKIGTSWNEGYYMILRDKQKSIELAQQAMEN
jgi:DNA-binding response OmpR family regulator